MEPVQLRDNGVEIYNVFGRAHQAANDSNASTIRRLQFQQERFQLWARSLGLFQQGHASLDYRVRDAFLVQQPLSSMLQMLLENLEELVSIILGERRPFEEQEQHYNKSEKDDQDEDEELDYSDSESSIPANLDTQSDSAESFHEADCRLQLVTEAIDSLYSLATKIRNPKNRPQRSLDQMHKRMPSNERAVHIQERERLETMIVAYVQRQQILELLEDSSDDTQQNILSQYCLEDNWIIRRVGIANARRRLQFAYWKQHAHRLGDPAMEPRENLATKEKHKNKGIPPLDAVAVENQGQSLNQPMSSAPQQSMATSATQIPSSLLKPQDATSVISHQSRVSTVFSPKGDKVTWPSPLNVTDGSNFFSCPYCLLLCPKGYLSPDSWRKHLIHDLQPYNCTYELCNDPNRLYGSRQEWIDHESQHTRVWHCQQHAAEFETQPEYVEHLKQHHEDTKSEHFSAELLSSAVGPSIRPRRECPFCPTRLDSLIEMQKHLEFHLERLAVLALPRDEDDMDTNQGSNLSSQSHEALQRGRRKSVSEDFQDEEWINKIEEDEDEDEDEIYQDTTPPTLTEDNLEKESLLSGGSAQASFLSLWLDAINAPTFSKAVHFDSHLEHVQYFPQVDGPLVVRDAESPSSMPATQDPPSRHSESPYIPLSRRGTAQELLYLPEEVGEAPEEPLNQPIRSPAYGSSRRLAPGRVNDDSKRPRSQGYLEYLGREPT
ncbi:hypothetical protein O1611_g1241 [Lasiodiplodia mahajangana]|uniref:Uncharacterized protein n=1 Tax=Lasiodiplodia mahajangana TaxID=1108764 RepID=A0ACC2JYV0_9PEZI|nr:hypothetical protein O1611_g1241 [Lasiodiplodia mahajangana]